MVVEIYADESRYFCPDHPYANSHKYKIIMSDEMAKELTQTSDAIWEYVKRP